MKRALGIAGVVILGLVAAVAITVMLATRSDPGRALVRRAVTGILNSSLHGRVSIGGLEGNVLGSFTLTDVAITDSAGAPFLTADRIAVSLDRKALWSKRVILSRLSLIRPVIRLTRRPNEAWNAVRIFPSSTPSADTTPGFGSWVALRDVTIEDGAVVIQQPWTPDASLAGAARDSAIALVLSGRGRARVDRVDYGLRQSMDFTDIDAHVADLIVATPDSTGIAMQLDTLSMVAAPFHAPTITVRQLAGAIHIGNDSVTARRVVLRLPDTHATGSLSYAMASGDILASLAIDTLAFADLRAVYPPLPESGGGRLALQAAIRTTAPSVYTVRDVRLHAEGALVEGALGLTLSDSTTRLDATDLRFTRVSTALVERLLPGVASPVVAAFSGRARLTGPLDAMQTDVDATITVARQPAFRVTARGGLGIGTHVTAQQLRLTGDDIPVTLAREFKIDQPVGGTVTVVAMVSGSSASRFRGTATLTHREAANVSRLTAEGTIAATGEMPVELDLRLDPVALALARHWLPDSIDVRGDVTGTAHVAGTTRDLATQLHLELPAGGTVDGDVRYQLPADTVPVVGAALTFGTLDVQAIMPALPRTAISGTATVDSRGTALATMNTAFTAMLGRSTVDSTEVREVALRGAVRNGVLAIDTLRIDGAFGSATAHGTFGLAEGTQGTLYVRGEVPDLKNLAQWLATGDTGVVAPRPARAVRIARRAARADSIRLAGLAEQDPAAMLAADLQGLEPDRPTAPAAPVAIRRDAIAGSLLATGTVTGNIGRATGTADVRSPGMLMNGSQVGAVALTATWRHDSTTRDTIDVAGTLDSLQLQGFEFDSTRFRIRHVIGGTGDADVAVFLGDSATESSAAYQVIATYTLPQDARAGEVRLRDVRMRVDSTAWRSTREGVVHWRGGDIAIDSLELRDGDGPAAGRIFVSGTAPVADAARVDVAWDSVRIAPLVTMLQGDLVADGLASGRLAMRGTRASPRFNGELTLTRPMYDATVFPQVHAALDYDARALTIDAEVTRASGGRLGHIAGTIPLDLSLTDSAVTRLPDATIALVVEGDSIPLSPLAEFTDQLTTITGRAYGRVVVSGTARKPHLAGGIAVDVDSARLTNTGVAVTDVVARLHMVGDTLVLDTLVGRSGGAIRGSGRIVLADPARPVLDLRVEAADAMVVDDSRGKLYAEAQINVSGPLDTLAVGGRVTITRGVIHIPEPDALNVISMNDPAIFAVVDTATARGLGMATESPALDNMRLAIDLRVNRGTFARSPDANVEVYGAVRIRLDSTTQGRLGLTGQLLTDYGDYRFMSKHFVVTRGSVRFTGGTDLNPMLQVVATYRVPQSSRAPLDIRVMIGGTLDRPVVSLESDAQPAMSNSDLIAMLAFGKSSSSLLQSSSSSGGGQAGSPLNGNAAALSAQMLGSMAIDAIADQSTDDLTRITRADVVNITPGELPPDLSMGGFETLLKGTEIEIGRYLDRQTFVMARVRMTLVVPGATFERRMSERFRWRATYDTRFLQETPSLSTGIEPRTIPVIGSMFAWTFVW